MRLCARRVTADTRWAHAHLSRASCKRSYMYSLQAASTYFSWKLGWKISKFIVQLVKSAYLESLRKRTLDSSDEIAELHPRKRGHLLLLGNKVDEQIQMYLRKV